MSDARAKEHKPAASLDSLPGETPAPVGKRKNGTRQTQILMLAQCCGLYRASGRNPPGRGREGGAVVEPLLSVQKALGLCAALLSNTWFTLLWGGGQGPTS